MKITIIGNGYVGSVTFACLADVGIKVSFVDIDHKKIEGLKNGMLSNLRTSLKAGILCCK